MRLLKRYIDHFDSLMSREEQHVGEHDIEYWRNFLFYRGLSTLLALASIVIVPSFIMCLDSKLPFLAVADATSYVAVVVLSSTINISHFWRKTFLIAVLYALSVILLFSMGIEGPGYLFLILMSLLITLFHNSKAGYLSVFFNSIAMFLYTFGAEYGWMGILPLSGNLDGHLVVGLNFVFINLVSVILVNVLLKGLESTITNDRFLRRKAQESDALKSSFIANISHEIRTPLNSILGFTSLMTDSSYSETEKDKFMNSIHSSSEQLLSIINSIVNISIIESGQLEIQSSHFFLKDVTDETDKIIAGIEQSDAVKIVQDIDPLIAVYSDKSKIIQVLTNLITNAIKFTSTGEIRYGFRKKKPDLVEFFVIDTGTGIPPEIIGKLFTRFYKPNHTKEFKPGTGLGLAISKGIIEALGGEIWVESTLGEGTSFFFTLPIE